MKIADALMLQQDMATEIGRLKSLAERDSWRFQSRGSGEDLVPAFNVDENHKRIMDLTRLKRKLSRAISVANNTVELDGVDESDYDGWL